MKKTLTAAIFGLVAHTSAFATTTNPFLQCAGNHHGSTLTFSNILTDDGSSMNGVNIAVTTDNDEEEARNYTVKEMTVGNKEVPADNYVQVLSDYQKQENAFNFIMVKAYQGGDATEGSKEKKPSELVLNFNVFGGPNAMHIDDRIEVLDNCEYL